MNTSTLSLMQKAKSRMLMKHVFFATIVLSTPIKPSKLNSTAWTDMTQIGYNEEFIEGLKDIDLVLFVLAHEVMHIVLKHGLRRGSRNPTRWNIACDFAINWMLFKMGFKIWSKCYCDAKYEGMSAEQIYDLREKDRSEGGKGKGPKGKGRPQPGGGQGTPDDGGDDDQGGFGDDVAEPEKLDPTSKAHIEQDIQQRVAQAASLARLQGSMPGELERLVDGILNPPQSWKELLRDFAVRTAPINENWGHRNRRFTNIYLPRRHSETMGEIVLIGDTSGSIGDVVFAQVAAEMKEIVEQVRPERLRIIWADDTECAREEVFEENDEIILHPKGGGGTDMRKPLKFVERYDPIVVILITDGYTPWPDAPPSYPLITVSTTKVKCPHGQTVHFIQDAD